MRLRNWLLVGMAITLPLAAMVLIFMHPQANADTTPSPWLVAPPVLEKLGDINLASPLPPSIISNRDCQQREVITRPKRLAPPQSQLSIQSCVVDTGYGALATSGGTYLQRAGGTVYGDMRNNAGGSTIPFGIPYSSTGLVANGGTAYGSYLYFYDELDKSLSSSAIFTGEVTHKLPLDYTASLHDVSGNRLAAQTDSMSFSADGQWMVVDIPFVAMVRVNTVTRQVLPFGEAINYSIGLTPAYRTAISTDGRYAVVASKNFSIFKLYDLSTCGAVPSVITTKVSCTAKDLLPFMQQTVPGFTSMASMRLRSDHTLDMYVNAKPGAAAQLYHEVMTAAGTQATGFQYLALGDSFASGEGAYQYKSITDNDTNKCHLSQRSYPYLISATLQFGKYESVACSGAKILDIGSSSDTYKDPQAKGKNTSAYNDEVLNNFLPGYRPQNQFINQYNPNIITVSVGGNDVGFTDKIKRCLDSDTCYSSYEDRVEIVQEINDQFYRLTGMYGQLKDSATPSAKIYVIGYPQIGDPNGNCADNVHLNHDELVFSQQLVSYLNSVIKTAAANVGVAYVDTEDAFAGHKLCETDSWGVAVNGLTAGNDIANLPFVHGPIGNESYHPNFLGHEFFRDKILQQTNNFTAPMPAPNPTLNIPAPADSMPILQAPHSNRTIKKIKNITGTDGGVIQAGETWVQDYSALSPFLKASSTVHAWLNSTPTDLGTYSLDAAGNLSLQITLPDSVPAGFHTLHLYGKNTSDEDVDAYQTVYVTNAGGDGACLVTRTSGEDTDKDGIDDACDPFIDKPPLAVVAPVNQMPPMIPPPSELPPPNPPPLQEPPVVIVETPPPLPPVIDVPPVIVVALPNPTPISVLLPSPTSVPPQTAALPVSVSENAQTTATYADIFSFTNTKTLEHNAETMPENEPAVTTAAITPISSEPTSYPPHISFNSQLTSATPVSVEPQVAGVHTVPHMIASRATELPASTTNNTMKAVFNIWTALVGCSVLASVLFLALRKRSRP